MKYHEWPRKCIWNPNIAVLKSSTAGYDLQLCNTAWYVAKLIYWYLHHMLKYIIVIAHCCRLVDIGKAMGCKVKMDKSQEVPSIVIQLVAPLKFPKPLTGARPKARRWQEIRLLMDDKRTRVVYSVTDLFGSKQFIDQKEFLYRACTL